MCININGADASLELELAKLIISFVTINNIITCGFEWNYIWNVKYKNTAIDDSIESLWFEDPL